LEEEIKEPTRAMHPEDLPRVMVKWRADMAAGEPYEGEMRLLRADGEYRWFLVRTVPLRDHLGKIVKWFGTSTEIEDRMQAEDALRCSLDELRSLAARLETIREEERTRVAREIHDELGSALTTLKWDTEGLLQLFSGGGEQSLFAIAREKLEAMIRLTDSTINVVKRIASELRPSVLDDLGLIEAIEAQAQQFQDRTRITSKFDSALDTTNLSREQSIAILRIFQETLTNILRHANATLVEITTEEKVGEFVLTIRDNGVGITDAAKSQPLSLGLLGMQERARLVGGTIDITRADGGGTTVTVRAPLSKAPAPDVQPQSQTEAAP
jgi:signal transduction histidine kinase